MASSIYILAVLILSSILCEASRILVVYPMPSRSHAILGEGIVRTLLKDEHEVTYITAVKYKNPSPKLRQIDVSDNFKLIQEAMISIQKILIEKYPKSNDNHVVKNMMISIARRTLEDKNVQALLNNLNEHFNLVIVEWMFSEITAGLAVVFNCPLVWVSSIEANSLIVTITDTAPSPAYTADILSGNVPPFTFWQRVKELWYRLTWRFNMYMYYDDMERKEYERLLAPIISRRGRVPPSYYDIRYNASLVLGNSHVSIGQAITVPQNYKPIGGFHIEENIEPLPEDLKRLMDNANNGVIYFSMGSILKSKDWPEETKQNLLKMFGELKQTVLWKFEEDMPNVPENVHILKWAPQPSILSHPNCKLFITHGGLLSQTETIHYGVPVIGIPVFGDQFMNVKRAVAKGFALEVKLSFNVAEDLKIAVQEIIYNPTYSQRVKELSFIYHDRIAKPQEELSHWVKHVISTRGALHLRSPAFNVPFYQQIYLDLIAIIIVTLILARLLLKVLFKTLFGKKKVVRGKKNN